MKELRFTKPVTLSLSVLILTSCAMAQGPLGDMWLTAGDQEQLFEISGGVVSTYSMSSNQYGIAAYGTPGGDDVRTQGNSTTTGTGTQYINGTATGTTYGTSVGEIFDGTENAQADINYGIQWTPFGGGVYQYNQNWGDATLLFKPEGSDGLGIAYDAASGTLYCEDRDGQFISNYTLGGTLLSQFSIASGCAGLAMDTDGTLWTLQQGSGGLLLHYSETGAYLGDFNMNTRDNILGMEIAPPGATPEPLTVGLGIAGVGMFLRRRMKAATA